MNNWEKAQRTAQEYGVYWTGKAAADAAALSRLHKLYNVREDMKAVESSEEKAERLELAKAVKAFETKFRDAYQMRMF